MVGLSRRTKEAGGMPALPGAPGPLLSLCVALLPFNASILFDQAALVILLFPASPDGMLGALRCITCPRFFVLDFIGNLILRRTVVHIVTTDKFDRICLTDLFLVTAQ